MKQRYWMAGAAVVAAVAAVPLTQAGQAAAQQAKAQATVDNAHMRYFIIHAHKLLDPSKD